MFLTQRRESKQNIVAFIQCVEKYPVIYNYTLTGYRSDEQEKAWNEISEQMGESAANCKEKWKNLRACLCRHLRTQVNSSWKRPYYLADYMKFVIPFTKYGRPPEEHYSIQFATSTSDNETEDADEDMDTLFIKQEIDDEIEISEEHCGVPVPVADYGTEVDGTSSTKESGGNESSETNVVTGSQDAVPRIRMKRVLQKIEPLEKVKVEYSNEKKQRLFMSNNYNSPELEFFKSLLPDIERMDSRQKIQFKMSVLNTIDSILYADKEKEKNTINSKEK